MSIIYLFVSDTGESQAELGLTLGYLGSVKGPNQRISNCHESRPVIVFVDAKDCLNDFSIKNLRAGCLFLNSK
jgi:hypothetical protein